jgi:hypothetical protein
MAGVTKDLALVSETSLVTLAELTIVAAAVNKQIQGEFSRIWGIKQSIAAFPDLESVPACYWAIIVEDDPDAESAGYHVTDGEPMLSSSMETIGHGLQVTRPLKCSLTRMAIALKTALPLLKRRALFRN